MSVLGSIVAVVGECNTEGMVDTPRILYRMVYEHAVGWEHPTKRERKTRTFTAPEYVGRQLARIEALPSHLKLLGIYVSGPIEWSPVDPDEIPRPDPDEGDDDV